MDDGYWPWRIAFLGIIFVLFALIHGFEKAMQNVNTSALEKRAEEGDSHASVLLDTLQQQSAFTCIRLFLMFGTGFYVGVRIFPLCAREGAWWYLLIAALLFLLLVAGIMVPRKMAARSGEFWLSSCLGPIRLILYLFRPLTFLVDCSSNLLIRLAGFEVPFNEEVTEEEIISMVNEGNEQGVLEDREAEMITNVLAFGDKTAENIMTRRKEITAFEGHETLQTVLEQILQGSKSRFPVYDEELDNIIGILYLRDAVQFGKEEQLLACPLMEIEGLLRKAEFIPETRKVDLIFRFMQSRKIHMMLVIDEYGQLAGLVTLEDLLEEIVGSIFDEYDEIDQPYLERVGEDAWIIDGKAPLYELEKRLDVEFEPEEDIDTLNGFLLYRLGHFPEQGENAVVSVPPYDFTVLRVENKMVQKVYAVRKQNPQSDCAVQPEAHKLLT